MGHSNSELVITQILQYSSFQQIIPTESIVEKVCLFVCNRGDTTQYHGGPLVKGVGSSSYSGIPNSKAGVIISHGKGNWPVPDYQLIKKLVKINHKTKGLQKYV